MLHSYVTWNGDINNVNNEREAVKFNCSKKTSEPPNGSTGNKALREPGPHLSNVLLGFQSLQFQMEPFAYSSVVGPSKMCLDGQEFDFPLLNREAFSLLV